MPNKNNVADEIFNTAKKSAELREQVEATETSLRRITEEELSHNLRHRKHFSRDGFLVKVTTNGVILDHNTDGQTSEQAEMILQRAGIKVDPQRGRFWSGTSATIVRYTVPLTLKNIQKLITVGEELESEAQKRAELTAKYTKEMEAIGAGASRG